MNCLPFHQIYYRVGSIKTSWGRHFVDETATCLNSNMIYPLNSCSFPCACSFLTILRFQVFICHRSAHVSATEHTRRKQTCTLAHIPRFLPKSSTTFYLKESPLLPTDRATLKRSQKDTSITNMSSFVSWLMWMFMPCLYAAPALSSSSTIASDQRQPGPPTMIARSSPVCVKTLQNPDWSGAMDAKDCADAIARLWDRVSPYGYTQWNFWASIKD